MLVPEVQASRRFCLAISLSLFFVAGMARAEIAGKVNYAVGEVAAVAADNSRRTLARGDAINSGERLETGARGRMQIRFTDGSFLSLQPNSRFGVDTYAYNHEKPEQGQLVFNFIQGGMRTISGFIGKVNRASYQIKSPMGTIGIRGTDYAVTISGNDLFLNVMKGMVKLGNEFGSADIKAGQTYLTSLGKAPTLFNGPYPGSVDPIEPDVDPALSAEGAAAAAATAAALGADLAEEALPERPRLENYDSYNQFLQAMYAYKKTEADRKRTVQDDNGKALDPEKLKAAPITVPDMSTETLDSPSTPSLVTEGPMSIDAAVAQAQALQLPHMNPIDNYHRSTFKDFPLAAVDAPSMEQAVVKDSFNLGLLANSQLLDSLQVKESSNNPTVKRSVDKDQITLMMENGNYELYLFGNRMYLNNVKGVTITIEPRR